MYLESDSVFLTGTVLSLGLVLFSWALAITYRSLRAFGYWAAGNTMVVIGIALLTTQGTLHPVISILLANGLLVAGLGFVGRGLEAYAQRLTAWPPAVAAYVVLMAAWSVATFVWPNFPVRASLLALAALVIASRIIKLLLVDLPDERQKTPWLIATLVVTLATLASALLVNAVMVAVSHGTSIRTSGNAPILSYLLVLVSLLVWTFGFFSLVLFRDHRKLQAVLATRDRMMALIAHDLRGPVGSVAMMLGMVKDPQLDDDDKAQLIEAATETASESVKLMETLLDWALAKQVKTSLVVEPLEVGSLLEASIAPLMALAQTKGVALSAESPQSAPPVIHTDRRTVTTIIRNLVSNALKFTPVGGSVRVSYLIDATSVQLIVADTGPGLPEGLVERLNRGFALTSTPGTAGEKGTGLGLSLCHDFAEANGGTLEFASSGAGTRVTLRLPNTPSFATGHLLLR